jgi:hypothetical protein
MDTALNGDWKENFFMIDVTFENAAKMKRKLCEGSPGTRVLASGSRSAFFNIPRALITYIMEFLVGGIECDNQLYRVLCLICKSWRAQEMPIFSISLNTRIQRFSWLHGLCCGEITIRTPKRIFTHARIAHDNLTSYERPGTVVSFAMDYGLCCWSQFQNFQALQELTLTDAESQDYRFLTTLKKFTLHLVRLTYPLHVPRNVHSFTLCIDYNLTSAPMQSLEIHLSQVEDFEFETRFPSDVGALFWSPSLTNLRLKLAESRCHEELAYPLTLRHLDLTECNSRALPSLLHLTNLQSLALPLATQSELLSQLGVLNTVQLLRLGWPLIAYDALLGWRDLREVKISSTQAFPTLTTFQENNFHTLSKSSSIERLSFGAGKGELVIYEKFGQSKGQ